MADLNSDQLSDLQADLAVLDDEAVWGDDALNRLFTRANGGYEMALWFAIRQLYFAALGDVDYTSGQTSEKGSQRAEALLKALNAQWVVVSRANQVRIVGMRSVPPIEKELPYGEEHPDIKNRRHDDNLPRPRTYSGYSWGD